MAPAGGADGRAGSYDWRLTLTDNQSNSDSSRLKSDDVTSSADESCDLFVSSSKGADTNNGTMAAPFATLQHAIWWGDPETQGDRTICLRAEIHRLNATVTIGSDLAHAGRGLTITTYDHTATTPRALLSGGILVGPFSRKNPGDAWLTATPPTAKHHRPSLMLSPAPGSDNEWRWLQRARLPRPNPADALNRFTGDASTFKYIAPLQEPNASKLWPSIDHHGFKYNRSDSFAQHLPLYRQDEVQVLHFHAWST